MIALTVYGWTLVWIAWALGAAITFGVLEWRALKDPEDAHPPLTQVIRKHVPRWLIALVLGGFAFWGIEHFVL